MIGRRQALNMGKTLNHVADQYAKMGAGGLFPSDVVKDVREAVTGANEIMFQYYLIPRAIREEYYRKELSTDGVQLQDLPEGRV